MANEFIIKNGFQSKGNSQITGSLSVTGGITGSYTGSFTGDGSGLTGVPASSGIFGISDASGSYTYYSDLGTALTAATSGDVIVLFTNYTETTSTVVTLKDGVNINLNGHTYEYATADTNDTLTDGGVAATVTIFNGTLKRTNSSAPTSTAGVGLRISNASSDVTLQGVNVIAEDGSNTCYITSGKLVGGYFRQVGAVAGSIYSFWANGSSVFVRDVKVHADSKYARLDTGKIIDSYFRSDGNWGIYIFSGEAHNITGYSTANDGILVGTAKVFNSTGISSSIAGIDTSTGSEIYNCTGYSSASVGINNLGYAFNCSAKSQTVYAFNGGSSSQTYNCTAWSTASYAILSKGRIIKTSAVSTWNNAAGHGFNLAENNDEIVDCYAEVANASAYGVNAPTTSPYVTGFSGRGMTTLLNLSSNAQSNTPDAYGNILIG